MNLFEKIISDIKSFFKKLFSAGDEVTSKRVVGFSSFFCLFIAELGFFFLPDHPKLPQYMWWGFVAITSACFTLNVIETLTKLKSKTTLAQDIVKEDPSLENSDNAKEVLQSAK